MNTSPSTGEKDTAAIIAIAREAGVLSASRPEFKTIAGRECLVTQSGQITPLVLPEKLLDHPVRKRAHVSTYEPASFSDYVNRHKVSGATVLFGQATETAAGFAAILDGHGAGEIGKAGFGEHTASLTLMITPEWKRWVEKNEKFMTQQQFAEHIEDNLLDIVEPAPADLLEVAQGLAGMKNITFKSGRNLKDGAIKFELIETIEIAGSTQNTRRDATFSVPDKFKLQLVPFVGAAGVEIEARLRFRIGNDGAVSFAYILNRPYKVIETAFTVTCEEVEKETGIPVILGTGQIKAA